MKSQNLCIEVSLADFFVIESITWEANLEEEKCENISLLVGEVKDFETKRFQSKTGSYFFRF